MFVGISVMRLCCCLKISKIYRTKKAKTFLPNVFHSYDGTETNLYLPRSVPQLGTTRVKINITILLTRIPHVTDLTTF